jgi:hypothetical protein
MDIMHYGLRKVILDLQKLPYILPQTRPHFKILTFIY